VVGWAKRGPTGVIGTNKPDSAETVEKILEDFRGKKALEPAGINRQSIIEFFNIKKTPFVSYEDWKRLDQIEIERAKNSGKAREKFATVSEMLSALKNAKS
jgi:ferredoxin--NADP+ reductase